MRAHGEQRSQHQLQMIEQKACRAHRHDDDLAELDDPDQLVLGVFLAELPGQRREQKERQDEQQGAQIDVDRAIPVDAQLVKDGKDQ